MFGFFKAKVADVLSHWYAPVPNFSTSTLEFYTAIEKEIASGADKQAVLVSAGPIAGLRRAYPNFFLDTHEFLRKLDRIKKLAAN